MSLDFEKATDEDLMIAYQQGTYKAFDILYRRYSPQVYGFLQARLRDRNRVDDVFQATFLKLHQSRAGYRATFLFLPWLFVICRSVLIDFFRKTERSLEDLDPIALKKAQDASPHPKTSGFPELQELLNDLQPTQRQALELRYGADLSFEQMALQLETSAGNARQLVSRAVRELRSLMRKGKS